jgi:hypothetical protein
VAVLLQSGMLFDWDPRAYAGTPEKGKSLAAQLVSVAETRYTGLEQGN